MQKHIQILKDKYKLPFDEIISAETGERFTSIVKCMQIVGEWELGEAGYLAGIRELLGAPEPIAAWSDKKMAKYVFQYLVQNLITQYKTGGTNHLDETYAKSIAQATKWINENPWVFATGEDPDAPPKLDAQGNVAPKKGDKKVHAREIYDKNKAKLTTRKEWIDILVKEVGLSEAGASTYYHNLKTGKY